MKLAPLLALASLTMVAHAQQQQRAWDNYSDTWVATDSLGRHVEYRGEPRASRKVVMFYFLWLGPEAHGGGPWDITRILSIDPAAMQQRDNPLWGPVGRPHHWGEPLFGFYNSD